MYVMYAFNQREKLCFLRKKKSTTKVILLIEGTEYLGRYMKMFLQFITGIRLYTCI